MSRLHQEFARLYLGATLGAPPVAPAASTEPAERGSPGSGLDLKALVPTHEPGACVRALVIELARPAHWAPLAVLWQGVQADLGWPAPAIAVNGLDGLQLWFSLAEAVPVAQAQAGALGLQQRYLAELRASRLAVWPPSPPLAVPARLSVPALHAERQVWSAFVAPDLAAIFEETPWLDLPPGSEGQAGLLARCHSITPAAWQAALAVFTRLPADTAPASADTHPPTQAAASADPLLTGLAQARGQARAFLLQVMQDESTPLALRIEAAKALLVSG